MIGNREPSPFDSLTLGPASPRAFWQGRDPTSPGRFSSENFEREQSPSVAKRRSSIEKLKQASRVKNSAMFAREQKNEYDPTSAPTVERPLAAGRPLADQFQARGLEISTTETVKPEVFRGHRRGESQTQIPLLTPDKEDSPAPAMAASPAASQTTPIKPALSSGYNTLPRSFGASIAAWQDEEDDDDEVTIHPPRPLRRQAKSVTFDTAPPEINMYEMVTPDPSSVASGSREGSYESYDDDEDEFDHGPEDSFDASLEDTDKTPVVLPEDWRLMSPEVADTKLADTFEDPFSPSRKNNFAERGPRRTDSLNSEGNSRPLPALPSGLLQERRDSGGLAAAANRAHNAQRSLPVPPRPASVSKTDILNMGDTSMTLEDRLRLMGIQDSPNEKSNGAAKEAARLRKHGLGIHMHEDEETPEPETAEEFTFPRISRESILRRVKSRNFADEKESPDLYDQGERKYDVANLDPDVPIPSREASSNFDDHPLDAPVKIEEEDEEVDIYSIPELYGAANSETLKQMEFERETSVIHHTAVVEDQTELDDASFYSSQLGDLKANLVSSGSGSDDEGPPTPRAEQAIRHSTPLETDMMDTGRVSLPEVSALMDDTSFQMGLKSYMSQSSTPPPPPPPAKDEPFLQHHTLTEMEAEFSFLQRTSTPEGEHSFLQQTSTFEVEHSFLQRTPTLENPSAEEEEQIPDSPSSVIRHDIWNDNENDSEEEPESPSIPEPAATIKAPGGNLKTRLSSTPADMAVMANTRRQVSGQMPPPIPERSPNRSSVSPTRMLESYGILDIPEEAMGDDLSFGMDKAFDRVIESSHRGYLTRQNTKVVIAKRNFSNETSSDGRPSSADQITKPSSPRKPSHERTKSWQTEPWNGSKVRRKSLRTGSGAKRTHTSGPAPPMPGQESAVGSLDPVVEDKSFHMDEQDDNTERGRLFVKVVGVKDLDLPLPTSEPTFFQLTLDNGLHCVTTSWLELGRSAPIGQEFELVVLNDLEFQLTLQTKLTPPPQAPVTPPSPTRSNAKSKKTSFRSFLSSPKKRREAERVAQQEQEDRRVERERAQSRLDLSRPATSWDLLHELVGDDGSFGRAYVCLKNHEKQCFGRPLVVDMPIFNEWALEDQAICSSVKSKMGGMLRRPPYQVGNLTLQLLYVPRPKAIADDDMPKSMNACIREMKEAEDSAGRVWEGILSQQGGDCPVSVRSAVLY